MNSVTHFESPLPVYVGVKDKAQPEVVMATSVELRHHGDVVELVCFSGEQIVARFHRDDYDWWMEDRFALFD